jgi:adenosylcobinamide kinase/adenosylcobinamide-phosphate guanylyltransferase
MPGATLYRHVLVIGGTRSGKSGYARSVAEESFLSPVMLATGEARDAEMAERIERHRRERSARWKTVEEPLELIAALRSCAAADRIVVVDCVTLWLSNLLLANRNLDAEEYALEREIAGLAGPVLFVTNEVGCGIVPAAPLGRAFRDAQGRLNQMLARSCEAVVQVTAGLPVQIKPAVAPRIVF